MPHPYNYHPHWYAGWHRPSRLWWFALGALAATLYIKRDERHRNGQRTCWHANNHCIRSQLAALPTSTPPSGDRNSSSLCSTHDVSRAINNIPPSSSTGSGTKALDVEKDGVVDLGQKAGDKLVEMSEATLETVLSTVEALKAKLAEHRAEREKHTDEESKRTPPERLV